MWNPSRARLSPDPVGFHSEALGELVSSEEAIHHVSLDETNRCRRPQAEGRRTSIWMPGDRRQPTLSVFSACTWWESRN